jgi:hypothetical protein
MHIWTWLIWDYSFRYPSILKPVGVKTGAFNIKEHVLVILKAIILHLFWQKHKNVITFALGSIAAYMANILVFSCARIL